MCPLNLEIPSFLYFKSFLSFFLFPLFFCSEYQFVFLSSYCLVCHHFHLIFPFYFISCDFLHLACALNSIYLFSAASKLTFISLIALFLSSIYFLSSAGSLFNWFSSYFSFDHFYCFFELSFLKNYAVSSFKTEEN